MSDLNRLAERALASHDELAHDLGAMQGSPESAAAGVWVLVVGAFKAIRATHRLENALKQQPDAMMPLPKSGSESAVDSVPEQRLGADAYRFAGSNGWSHLR